MMDFFFSKGDVHGAHVLIAIGVVFEQSLVSDKNLFSLSLSLFYDNISTKSKILITKLI